MSTDDPSIRATSNDTLCGAPTKASRPPGGPPPHGLGALWFGGWLFTIGFLKLVWWKALVGLVIWPYFVGAYFAR